MNENEAMPDSGNTDAPDTGEKRRPFAQRQRSATRLAAVQCIYQFLQSGDDPLEKVPGFKRHFLPVLLTDFQIDKIDDEHFNGLVFGVADQMEELLNAIADKLRSGWTVDRLAVTERSVLVCAILELMKMPHVPARVVITEYTAIAESCGSDAGFINAVLDTAANQLRQQEMVSGKAGD